MTTRPQGAAFSVGDNVRVKAGTAAGAHAGKKGKVVKIIPTQATTQGKESVYAFKTDVSPEFYREQDLERG